MSIISSQSIAIDNPGYAPFVVAESIDGATAGAVVYATHNATTGKRSLALTTSNGAIVYGIVCRVISGSNVEVMRRGEAMSDGLSLKESEIDHLAAIGVFMR